MISRKTRLEDALFKRGFLIGTSGISFTLSKGSHQNDKDDLSRILTKLNIKHTWTDETLSVEEQISDKQYQDIILWPARNHEADTSMSHGSWRNFTRRKHGPKARSITLESGVASLVKALSTVGISTVCSCDGHGRVRPKIDFASYHNAVWFEYLNEKYFGNLELNYSWKIDFHPHNLAFLTASGNKYDVLLLQEDSSKMADILLVNDEEIRQLKLRFFFKNKKPTKRLLVGKNYETTKSIMEEIMANY